MKKIRKPLLEIPALDMDEAWAREGVCPACRGVGVMGQSTDSLANSVKPVPYGVCICLFCSVMWWFPAASRRLWN